MKIALLVGNRGNKNLGDEIILAGMIKYLLSREENIQSEQVTKGSYRNLKIEKHYNFKPFSTKFDKLIIPVADKNFVKNFLKQFLSNEELKKIELVRELPHGIRSFLKYIIKGKFLDLPKYFKTNTLILGGGEIFTEECRSGPLFFFITALPFFIKKLLIKILTLGNTNLKIFLFGGIQKPYRWFNKLLITFWINQANGIFVRDFDSIEDVCKIKWNSLSTENKNKYWTFIKRIFFVFDHSYILFKNTKILDKSEIPNNCIININPIGRKKFSNKYIELINKHKFDNIFYIAVNKIEDKKFYFLLKEKIKKNKIKLIDWKNWSFFINLIKENVKLGIVTRLHMFLILYYLEKEIIVFPYQKKIIKMLNTIKMLKNLTNKEEKVIII